MERCRVAVDFWVWQGVDEKAYRQRSETEEQRKQRQSTARPVRQEHLRALLVFMRRLLITSGKRSAHTGIAHPLYVRHLSFGDGRLKGTETPDSGPLLFR